MEYYTGMSRDELELQYQNLLKCIVQYTQPGNQIPESGAVKEIEFKTQIR